MSSIKIVFDGDFNANELSKILCSRKKISVKKLYPLLPKRGIYVTEIEINKPGVTTYIENRNGLITAGRETQSDLLHREPNAQECDATDAK
jgi:hypothetical protein